MKSPWKAGRVLTPREFESYYKKIVWDCRRCSIRPQEHLPLLDFPLLMKPGEWPRLAELTKKLSQEVGAAEQELLRRPDLFESLGLMANISKVLKGCEPKCRPKGFARIMRFDFYFTDEGWRFSEANPDSPGGFIEAYGLTRAMADFYPGFSPPPNPAAAYAEAIHKFGGTNAMVAFFHAGGPRLERRCHEFIMSEIEKLGMRGILVNTRHLIWKSNLAQVVTSNGIVTPNLLVRKLVAKFLPSICRQRSLWVPWFCGSKTPMSNPGTSILVETKRFHLIWKELDTPMPMFRAFSPESRSPIEVSHASQSQWVFKPAFGSGALGIGIAGVTKKRTFNKIAEEARGDAANWVAQRRFESVPVSTERGPGHVCFGIFAVDGAAVGIFGRIKGKPLVDNYAMSIPVLIPQGDLENQKGKRDISEKFNLR